MGETVKSNRRLIISAASLIVASLASLGTYAASLADLSNQDAAQGLRAALVKGSESAVSRLGVTNGFLNDPKVKIPLPPALSKAEEALRLVGLNKDADELVQSMNHAAETAVAQAKPLLTDAIRNMSVTDAKNILTGGDDSVTRFFKDKTQAPLTVKFLPIVKQATDRVGLANRYNSFAARASKLGLIKGNETNIESYVTEKALDGLYTQIGDEERAIRQNPVAAGSAILTKVFGALK